MYNNNKNKNDEVPQKSESNRKICERNAKTFSYDEWGKIKRERHKKLYLVYKNHQFSSYFRSLPQKYRPFISNEIYRKKTALSDHRK